MLIFFITSNSMVSMPGWSGLLGRDERWLKVICDIDDVNNINKYCLVHIHIAIGEVRREYII